MTVQVCRFPDAAHGMEPVAAAPVAAPGSGAAPAESEPAGAASSNAAGSKGGPAPVDGDDVPGSDEGEEDIWDKLPVRREISMAVAAGLVGILVLLCSCCFCAAVRTPAGGKNTTRSESHLARQALSRKLVSAAIRGRGRGRRGCGAEGELCCISSEVSGMGLTPGRELRVDSQTLQCSPYVELPETLGETTVVTVATGGSPSANGGSECGALRPKSGKRTTYFEARTSGPGGGVMASPSVREESVADSEEMNWSPPVAIPWLTDSNDAFSDAATSSEFPEPRPAVRSSSCDGAELRQFSAEANLCTRRETSALANL